MTSNENDACIPQAVIDFVFDLAESVTRSQITEEQSRLYNVVFRDLCQKYFASSPWPSPQSIANECNGDPLFLAIYRELTHRHWHSVSRPSLRDNLEGWDVYRDFFDELLDVAEQDAKTVGANGTPKLFLLPEWTFDILHEFVYQFQGFCQFRTSLYASANKFNLLPGSAGEASNKAPHHIVEGVQLLQGDEGVGAWNAQTVLGYLHRLVQLGTNKSTAAGYHYLGIFASVTLSRLECLLSDYPGCVQAVTPILSSKLMVTKVDQDSKSFTEVVHSVFAARLSLSYHAGVSFLMMRRYKDVVTMIGELCSYIQRGLKTGQLRKLPNADQLYKNYDRMIALLAIATHLCPAATVEESIAKVIREKHSAQLQTKEGCTNLFLFCAPKFVSPASPTFSAAGVAENAYKMQINAFEKELQSEAAYSKLRSYLKLYTSIKVSKLVHFGNDELTLASLKLKCLQLESNDPAAPSLTNASSKSALDIHYYLDGDGDDTMVHVDAPEKARRYENYFLAQTMESLDICKEAQNVNTVV